MMRLSEMRSIVACDQVSVESKTCEVVEKSSEAATQSHTEGSKLGGFGEAANQFPVAQTPDRK
jgi:hypothetical protein